MDTENRQLIVLVVDDNTAAASAIAEQVRELGHQATVVLEAVAAIQSASSEPPDVVLTDIYMAEMDGYELIRAIRANGGLMPIIAMSGGKEGYDTLGVAKRLGADAVINKPFRREDLGEVIDRCVGRLPKLTGA